MKKIIIFLSVSLLSFFIPINTTANTLENLPMSKSSKQWKVEIAEPDIADDSKSNMSNKRALYNFYSMDVKNIGSDQVELVRVEAYRDHPNSTVEHELFTVDFAGEKTSQPMFHHSNFPLYIKANELKIVLIWTKKNDNSEYKRKYREQFNFEL